MEYMESMMNNRLEASISEYEQMSERIAQLAAELEEYKNREQWIHDNAKTVGGGHGFTVTFFVPVDHEDIFCGISAAIKGKQ